MNKLLPLDPAITNSCDSGQLITLRFYTNNSHENKLSNSSY